MAVSKPVKLSVHAIKISSTPRFLRPFSTVAQNFALSFSPTHMPRTSFPVTGNRNLDIAKTGSQIFAAVAVPAVVRSFVLIVVFAVTKILIQFGLQTILHKFGNGSLEQVLDVVHAVDVRHLQQFTDLSSTGFFLPGFDSFGT